MGVSLPNMPVFPAPSSGLLVQNPAHVPPRVLNAGEAYDLFGASLAVKMNFVPQMLVAVAMDQLTQFVNFCINHRLSDLKKHSRVLKACIDNYTKGLKRDYGDKYNDYVSYVERYFDYVSVNRTIMWFSIRNLVNKTIPDALHQEAATHIAIIHNLLRYSEEWNRSMDKVIADKLKAPVKRAPEAVLIIIDAKCIEFEETWKCAIDPEGTIVTNVKVLSNRASELADAIIDEQNVSKR